MERRKFVVGLGALASGSAAAVGTGAFTSVEADRTVDVDVASDSTAYLRLEGTGGNNSDYVTQDGSSDQLKIDLSSGNGDVDGGGSGVNPDAITEIDDLFVIQNQGTQEIDVDLTKTGDNSDLIDFYANDTQSPNGRYDTSDGNTTILGDNSYTLGTGDDIYVSLKIDTEGEGVSDGDEILSSVTIDGEA